VKQSSKRRDSRREERIAMEIVADAYGPEEQAMGWYYYLEDQLHFPFAATCIAKRPISPLQVEENIEVIGMPSQEECEREVFVTIRWKKDRLAVPLSQLEPVAEADAQTREAVADWHYWVRMGYRFG
jgi:hypothetical protein